MYQQMLDAIIPKSKFEEYVSTNACYPHFSQPDYKEYAFMFAMEGIRAFIPGLAAIQRPFISYKSMKILWTIYENLNLT